jgi:hypothetical protein
MASDIATFLWHTGLDQFTKQEVYVAKGLRDRKMQRALMQFFKSENWFTVREALIQAGRQDLIGSGCDCLIPANPPKEALDERRKQANRAVHGNEDDDHYHTVANPAKGEKRGDPGGGPQVGPEPVSGRPVGQPAEHLALLTGREVRPAAGMGFGRQPGLPGGSVAADPLVHGHQVDAEELSDCLLTPPIAHPPHGQLPADF